MPEIQDPVTVEVDVIYSVVLIKTGEQVSRRVVCLFDCSHEYTSPALILFPELKEKEVDIETCR